MIGWKTQKKNKFILLWICMVPMAFSGCGPSVGASIQNLTGQLQEAEEKTSSTREEAIRQALGQMEGVVSVSVVVEGTTAIIGLTMEQGVDGEKMREEINTIVSRVDPATQTASVTFRPTLVQMIDQLEKDRKQE